MINGAKTWSTSAFAADYGLCLARTNWDVPKHDGLTMFLVPIDHPGITLRRINQVDGSDEFCEEFFDGVERRRRRRRRRGQRGWAVASRQLYHERRAVGGGSEFASGTGSEGKTDVRSTTSALSRRPARPTASASARWPAARSGTPRGAEQLIDHVYRSVRDGALPPAAGTLIRLFHAETVRPGIDTALAIRQRRRRRGRRRPDPRLRYLARQTVAIGGGTTEMARNVIGERVLNFPREYAADRGVPFKDVKRNKQG